MTGESSSRSTNRCAFVTGATGFIGSHLTRRLINEDWSVHILVRPSSDRKLLKDLEGRFQTHVHNGKTEQLCAIMADVKPNVVFHLASLFLVQHETRDILRLIESNLAFPTQLLEAMAKNGVSKLINTGTSWQHYENREYSPVNLYAATKQAFEAILKFYKETTPLKVITLKLFDTYGPNDPRPKLFSLLKKVAEEQKPLAMSPGEQLIDIVYIADVVDAFIVAAERLLSDSSEKCEVYAVSSGASIKLRDLVKIYESVIGKKLPIEWGGRPYRDREVMVPWSAGKKLYNWKPTITIEEGIKGNL